MYSFFHPYENMIILTYFREYDNSSIVSYYLTFVHLKPFMFLGCSVTVNMKE